MGDVLAIADKAETEIFGRYMEVSWSSFSFEVGGSVTVSRSQA